MTIELLSDDNENVKQRQLRCETETVEQYSGENVALTIEVKH